MMSSQLKFSIAEAVQVLERTPGVLQSMLGELSSSWTDADEGDDTWSPYTIVGHLIHGERTDWIPRARIILSKGSDRRFTPYDRFAQFHESMGKSLADLLAEFARLRKENLTKLSGWKLSSVDLGLEGEHPDFGAVSLHQLLATWVAHDLGHIAQVARIMAKRYRDDVGPWRPYLPVMDR